MQLHRFLQQQLLYPYHLQHVQVLNSEHYPHRLGFCQWFLDPNELDLGRMILFSDKTCFSRDGYYNNRNHHIWYDEIPHTVLTI